MYASLQLCSSVAAYNIYLYLTMYHVATHHISMYICISVSVFIVYVCMHASIETKTKLQVLVNVRDEVDRMSVDGTL